MAQEENALSYQIRLIEKAMKEAGVWSNEIPEWVIQYEHQTFPDVWQWLQFIYLPMRLNDLLPRPHYIAPVVGPFMTTGSQTDHILQLVVELDSISSTIEKK